MTRRERRAAQKHLAKQLTTQEGKMDQNQKDTLLQIVANERMLQEQLAQIRAGLQQLGQYLHAEARRLGVKVDESTEYLEIVKALVSHLEQPSGKKGKSGAKPAKPE